MKLSTAKIIGDILLAIRINRISDKEIKGTLTKDYLEIRRAIKDTDFDRDELAKKFRKDWADEISKTDKSESFYKAKEDTENTINEMYNKEVEITLSPVPAETLFDADLWGDDVTLGQIANTVDLLAANGVVEE